MQTTLEMHLIMVTKVGHWNRAGNIITGYQASNTKQREATPLFQCTMTLIYRKRKELMGPHTSLRRALACSLHTWAHANMHAQKHTQLKIDFHGWLCHFIGQMPRKISAVCWLVKVIFEMIVGIVLTRQADSLAKKRVRVCTQRLMLAFPQHCIVSCEGGSTIFHGNWLFPIPLAFTQGKRSWGWKWP